MQINFRFFRQKGRTFWKYCN